MPKLRILSLDVDMITYQDAIDKIISMAKINDSGYACFANVHMTVEAYLNQHISAAVNSATYVFADGNPLVTYLRLLYGAKQERIAGMDFMPSILEACAKNELSVFLYGGSEVILEELRRKINGNYPNLRIAGKISPPFRELKEIELKNDIDTINRSGAQIVLVSLGCPKQELWMSHNYSKINAVLLGVGGAFPVYAGHAKRAPEWMRDYSLEWLYRLIQEPGRMWRRYLTTNTVFIALFLKEMLNNFPKIIKRIL